MHPKTAALPFVLFGLIVSILIGSRLVVQEGERAQIKTRLDTTSDQVADRVESLFESHLELLAEFGDEFSKLPEFNEALFRARSVRYQAQTRGVQALNFVNVDGTIRWVEPEIGNRGALGFDLSKHPIAGPSFLAASAGTEVEVTPPLPLLQRGWGVAAYYRIHSADGLVGLANCVFRLSDVLDESLRGHVEPGFRFHLLRGDETLASLGGSPVEGPGNPTREVPILIQDTELTLRVSASPLGSSRNSWVDEAMLGLGVLLAGLLVWMVQIARYRRHDAEISAARSRVLLENAPDAILTLDSAAGRVLSANRRAFELFEFSEGEFLDLNVELLSPATQPDGRVSAEVFQEHLVSSLAGETPVFEWTIQTGSGGHRLTEVHLVAMPADGGSVVCSSIMDISERRELEDKLRRTSVHEAVGQLTSGVAHDFNNMLTAVMGATELLHDRCQGDAESVELADTAIEACERAGDLTRRLLSLGHLPHEAEGAVDLNSVIAGLPPMLSRVISENMQLNTRLNASTPVLGTASEIELVLLNLVVNARDAMPEGGTILLSSDDADSDTVAFSVKDSGQGIPPEVLDKMFEPFFTTKRAQAGTGSGSPPCARSWIRRGVTFELRAAWGLARSSSLASRQAHPEQSTRKTRRSARRFQRNPSKPQFSSSRMTKRFSASFGAP